MSTKRDWFEANPDATEEDFAAALERGEVEAGVDEDEGDEEDGEMHEVTLGA